MCPAAQKPGKAKRPGNEDTFSSDGSTKYDTNGAEKSIKKQKENKHPNRNPKRKRADPPNIPRSPPLSFVRGAKSHVLPAESSGATGQTAVAKEEPSKGEEEEDEYAEVDVEYVSN